MVTFLQARSGRFDYRLRGEFPKRIPKYIVARWLTLSQLSSQSNSLQGDGRLHGKSSGLMPACGERLALQPRYQCYMQSPEVLFTEAPSADRQGHNSPIFRGVLNLLRRSLVENHLKQLPSAVVVMQDTELDRKSVV